MLLFYALIFIFIVTAFEDNYPVYLHWRAVGQCIFFSSEAMLKILL